MKERHPSKVSVILPTYNEKGNIIRLIMAVIRELNAFPLKKEIIVVDDNSPDGTGMVAQKRFAGNKEVKVFIRTQERGFATAIRHGIERSTGDIIVVMDTDFNHDPKKLPQLISLLQYYDIVSGSRYVHGGNMPDRFRYYGSFLFNFLVRLFLKTQVQDNLCGYFSIRRRHLFQLDLDRIFFGFGDYFFRLIFYAHKKGFTFIEIPVVYSERSYGVTKTNLSKTFFKYFFSVLRLRFRGR